MFKDDILSAVTHAHKRFLGRQTASLSTAHCVMCFPMWQWGAASSASVTSFLLQQFKSK